MARDMAAMGHASEDTAGRQYDVDPSPAVYGIKRKPAAISNAVVHDCVKEFAARAIRITVAWLGDRLP